MGQRICSVDGCENPFDSRGMCRKHSDKARRSGQIPVVQRRNVGESPRQRIERIGWEVAENECWIYNGPRRRWGYTCVYIAGRGTLAAHRVSYEVYVGPIPDGLILMHSCDNPPCINPKHLRPGTNHENTQDMLAKGRHRTAPHARGRRRNTGKLTPEQVLEIRRLHDVLGVSRAELMHQFGISRSQVGKVVTRFQWKDI